MANPDFAPFRFNAGNDFLLNGKLEELKMPYNGKITISGNIILSKPIKEPVTLSIKKEGNTLTTVTLNNGQNILSFPISIPLNISQVPVDKGDKLTFELTCDGQIDWRLINTDVQVYYTEASILSDDGTTSLPFPVTDNFSDPDNPQPSILFHPTVSKRTFDYAKQPSVNILNTLGNYKITTIQPVVSITGKYKSGTVRYTLKNSSGIILYSGSFNIISYALGGLKISPITIPSIPSVAYIDYYVDDEDLGQAITSIKTDVVGRVILINILHSNMPSGLYTNYSQDKYTKFQNIYRGWTQFGYKPADASLKYIDENLLNLDYKSKEKIEQMQNDNSEVEIDENSTPESDIERGFNPLSGNFFIMYPNYATNKFEAYSGVASIYKDTMNNAVPQQTDQDIRDQEFPVAHVTAGEIPTTVSKRIKSKPLNIRGGASLGGFSAGGSLSWTKTEMLSDYMDLNGDGYPDVVAENNVQYGGSFERLR